MRLGITDLPQDLTSPLPVLFVGLAPTGPADRLLSWSQWSQYGALLRQTFTVTATTTGVALQLPPHPSSLHLEFFPPARQFSVTVPVQSVSGRVVTFRSLGGRGMLQVSYRPRASITDLISVADVVSKYDLPVDVYGCRLSGSHASGSFGGWSFQALYPGAAYNGVLVSGSETAFRVSGAIQGDLFYSHQGSVVSLRRWLESSRTMGAARVEAVTFGTSVPVGSTTLTGGASLVPSAYSFQQALFLLEDQRGYVVVPVFSVDQAMVQAFIEYNRYQQHRHVLVASPSGAISVSDPNVVLVTGSCSDDLGQALPAAVAVAHVFSFPYLPTTVTAASTGYPALSGHLFRSLGMVGIVRSPGYPLRLSDTISTDGTDHRVNWWLRAFFERAYRQVIGKPVVPPHLDVAVQQVLSSLPFVRAARVVSTWLRQEGTLLVQADVTLFDRVLHLEVPITGG